MHAKTQGERLRLTMAAGLVLLAGMAGGCGRRGESAAEKAPPGRPAPAGIETVTVESKPVPVRVDLVGTVTSENRVNISARIPSHVSAVFVSAGQHVQAGHLLLTLDDREIREQAAAAEAQLRQAETEYKRARQLFETRATTEQALTAAESMFQAAQAQFERVRVMLSYARITSPIAGVVTDRRVEAGDIAAPGQLLMAIYDPLRMRLEVPVPVRLIEKLQLDREIEITLERPAKKFTGRVTEIVAELDPMTRTQRVRAHIDDDSGALLPGTFGRLWFTEDERPQVLAPAGAVYRAGQLEFAQVVENGRIISRLVKTGARHDDQLVILSGLRGGERIVRQPLLED